MISKIGNTVTFSRQQQNCDNKVAFGLSPTVASQVLTDLALYPEGANKDFPEIKRRYGSVERFKELCIRLGEELAEHIKSASDGFFRDPVTRGVSILDTDGNVDQHVIDLISGATITPKSEQQEENVKAARDYIVNAVAPCTKDQTGEIVKY